jgi:hypothetical protein
LRGEQAPVEKNQFNPPKWILKTMSRTHIFLNRLTLGKMFNTLSGDEVCFVTMTGAKSGRSITIPLMYVPYKNGLSVRYRGQKMTLKARLATADEKPELWPVCDSHYAPYADYRARTDRDIPIFVCEPL